MSDQYTRFAELAAQIGLGDATPEMKTEFKTLKTLLKKQKRVDAKNSPAAWIAKRVKKIEALQAEIAFIEENGTQPVKAAKATAEVSE